MLVHPGMAIGTGSATHCPYCALQCGMHVVPADGVVAVTGDQRFPVNEGGLCAKGWSAAATLRHPDRLLTPLARDGNDTLAPVEWDEALDRIVSAFQRVRAAHGRDAVGVFGGGSLTNEKAYLLGKFARAALGTSSIDYNGRFCMSSAAAASIRAFGIDRGLPFPLEDIARAEVVLLVGANPAETMPPVMRYFEAQQRNGGKLIVVDPRRTATAQWATLHLRVKPGADAALANGLLHLAILDAHIDSDYIRERTEGFDAVRGVAAAYWPERVEMLTGIAQRDLAEAARLLGTARSAMVLTARGAEQHATGVSNVLAFVNLALALGKVGRPFSGFGTLTGQGNGQGGREHGQKADQLPGYRSIQDAGARRHIAALWGIPESEIPQAGRSAYELLESSGQPGGIRALFVMGSNPVVSAPNASRIIDRLQQLDVLVVCDFFLSETAALADVVLPSAQWAEEEGTMTNLEGRVIRRRRAMMPPAGVRSDIDILCAVAGRLGKRALFTYSSAADVFDELRQATRGGVADYSGITYDRIDAEHGVFWPCHADGHPGTPRLFTRSFPTSTGRARFHPVEHGRAAEEPDDTFPWHVTTGRTLAHYQSGTQTRRISQLVDVTSEPAVEMHPQQARRYRIADGERVVLRTRRGSAIFKARITPDIRPDTIFVPFHWPGDRSANRLTHDALDPVSRMPQFKVCAVRIEKPDA